MRFTNNSDETDLAVSVVVGFIMIIAIAMLGMTIYQQNVVPQNERASEVNHHRQSLNQLQNFHSAFMAASDGGATSTSFKPGLTYGSASSLFVHSPPSAGQVSVREYENPNVVVRNAEGVGQSGVFWNGNTIGDGSTANIQYTTSYFRYEPNYYHFQNAPNTYMSYGFLYKDYNSVGVDQRVSLTSQPIVEGENINLLLMNGDLSTSQVNTMTLQVKPVSASSNRVSLTNTAADQPVQIELPTRMSRSKWVSLLEGESCGAPGELTDGDNTCDGEGTGHVVEVQDLDSSDQKITLIFEEGVTYDVKMSEVYITSKGSTSDVPTTTPLYAAWKGTEDITIREESTVGIQAIALDKYNNPTDGTRILSEAVNLNSDADGDGNAGEYPGDCYGGFSTGDSYIEREECDNGQSAGAYYQRGHDTSANDGSTTFVYEAPNVGGDVRIEFRVCLGRYIDESAGGTDPDGGTLADCSAVSGNREV